MKDLQPLYFTLANGEVSHRKDPLTQFKMIIEDSNLSKNLFHQFWCSPVEFNIPNKVFTMVRLDKMYCVMFTNELINCRFGRFESFQKSIALFNKLAIKDPHYDLSYFEVLGIDYTGKNYRIRIQGNSNQNGDPLREL